MRLEELLRGILLGLLVPTVALALATIVFPRPPPVVQLLQLSHAYIGLVLLPAGAAYLFVHLVETLELRWAWRKLRGRWRAFLEPERRSAWRWVLLAAALTTAAALAFTLPLKHAYLIAEPPEIRKTNLLIVASLVVGNCVAIGFTVAVVMIKRRGLAPLNLSWLAAGAAVTCAISGLGVTATSPIASSYVDSGWVVHVVSGVAAVYLGVRHVVGSRSAASRRSKPAPTIVYRWRRPTLAVALPVALVSSGAALFLPVRDGHRFGTPTVDARLVHPIDAHFAELAPASCAPCHADESATWSESAHAHAARNPVFEALLRRTARDGGPDVARFCLGCHAPHALDPRHSSLDEVIESAGFRAGVQCLTCHRADQVAGAVDGEFSVRPLAADGFAFLQERPGELGERLLRSYAPYALIASRLPLHRAAYRFHTREAAVCGPCHIQTLTIPTKGRLREPLQDQFSSWLGSAAAEHGKDCATCHMPVYRTPIGDRAVDHRMIGASTYLAGLAGGDGAMALVQRTLEGRGSPAPRAWWDRAREPAGPLLELSAEIVGPLESRRVRITSRNSGRIGHSFPNGPTDLFDVWLALRVTDRGGSRELLAVGQRDSGDAPTLGASLFDAQGAEILDHRLWDVARVEDRGHIPERGDHVVELALPNQPLDGAVHVEASWKYRRLRRELVEHLIGEPIAIPVVEVGRLDGEPLVAAPG